MYICIYGAQTYNLALCFVLLTENIPKGLIRDRLDSARNTALQSLLIFIIRKGEFLLNNGFLRRHKAGMEGGFHVPT